MKKNSGQAVLIIVLIMAVALTIGMAIISRSITDVKLSSQDEESARAFSAAEAGLSDMLQQNLAIGVDYTRNLNDKISYLVTSEVLGDSPSILFPKQVAAGETQSLWLVGHDEDGNFKPASPYLGNTITVFWGNPGTAANTDSTPAIEATFYYKVGADFKVTHWAIDPNTARIATNKFIDSSSSNADTLANFQQTVAPAFKAVISFPVGTPYLMTLKLLYNNTDTHWIGVKSPADNITIPAQATCYKSTAKIIESDVSRAVYQCRYYKTPTGLFDYALYSDDTLQK